MPGRLDRDGLLPAAGQITTTTPTIFEASDPATSAVAHPGLARPGPTTYGLAALTFCHLAAFAPRGTFSPCHELSQRSYRNPAQTADHAHHDEAHHDAPAPVADALAMSGKKHRAEPAWDHHGQIPDPPVSDRPICHLAHLLPGSHPPAAAKVRPVGPARTALPDVIRTVRLTMLGTKGLKGRHARGLRPLSQVTTGPGLLAISTQPVCLSHQGGAPRRSVDALERAFRAGRPGLTALGGPRRAG